MIDQLMITLDIDWASESAIEETLEFFKKRNIPTTLFSTHDSHYIRENLDYFDVGLHPYFDVSSSQGSTISEVINTVIRLPHNIEAFRCHRFAMCNCSKEALVSSGMKISSNVCTDLEIIKPFKDRFGLWEVPIFFEDGAYLYRKHSLTSNPFLDKTLKSTGLKVFLIHPMHFCLNTPHFDYMTQIKKKLTRKEWSEMTLQTLNQLRSKEKGIRDLLIEILDKFSLNKFIRMSDLNFT